jgi:hypothetical protein
VIADHGIEQLEEILDSHRCCVSKHSEVEALQL